MGYRLDVDGGFARRRGDHVRQLLGGLGIIGQGTCGVFEFGRKLRDGAHDIADRGIEAVGQLVHLRLTLFGGRLFGGFFQVGLLTRPFDRLDLEHFDGMRHGADLVLALETRQYHREIAAGELFHVAHHAGQRLGDTARRREGGCHQ